MGFQLGPLLADCYMSKLKSQKLKPLIDNMLFYKRYMDDTFVIVDDNTLPETIFHLFNNCNLPIYFTLEAEKDNQIAFLDVLLTRQEDGSLTRSTHRKPTWSVQLTNFHSWTPIKYKRNLIRTLSYRIRKICSLNTVELELDNLRSILTANNYPKRLIETNIKVCRDRARIPTVKKKLIYLQLGFKGDVPNELVSTRIQRAIDRTFPAAKLCLISTPQRIFQLCVKDKLLILATSMCVYHFTCSCEAGYIGHTSRKLSKRISKHYPPWYVKGQLKVSKSSILDHLIDCKHISDPKTAFKVIYRTNCKLPRGLRLRQLAIAEALAIGLEKPNLCIHSCYVLSMVYLQLNNHFQVIFKVIV